MSDLPHLASALDMRDPLSLALFLDVDGTLLEFSSTPDGVEVPESLRRTLADTLERLDGALALVSGRAVSDLDHIFRPLELPAAGLHGYEIRGDGRSNPDHARREAALAAEKSFLHQTFENDPGILIEDKGPCVAVHFRRAPEKEDAVIEAVNKARSRLGDDFDVLDGHMLCELKPAGIGKGHAVETLMRDPPFHGRTPVFIGDDVTDEDGFRAVNDMGGVSVCVGPRRPTCAVTGLADVAAVRDWLEENFGTRDGKARRDGTKETIGA